MGKKGKRGKRHGCASASGCHGPLSTGKAPKASKAALRPASLARRKILITGVPGSGKTSVASLLAERTGAELLDINKVVEVAKLYKEIDPRDGSKTVKLKELQEELSSSIRSCKQPLIVEGHLGCEMKLPVSMVVVLRCEPKALRQRMASRNYPAEKIAANALSEALDYCTVWSERNYGKAKVWEIDTTGKTLGQVAKLCEKIIFGRMKRKPKPVSFPDALLREAIAGEKIREALR